MSDLPQVVCVGEALVDFLPEQHGLLRNSERFTRCMGGAPAKTAVGLARCGVKSALQTRVGNDELGHYLVESLNAEGVDTSAVDFDPKRRTGITFVQVNDSGARSFLFYRSDAAEKSFGPEHVDEAMIQQAAVLHLCTNLMETPCGREATLKAVDAARGGNTLVSADPNLRLHLWPSEDACRQAGLALVEQANVVKLSDDEATLLTGIGDSQEAARAVHRMGPGLVVVTLGEQGCVWSGAPGEGECMAPVVECVDSTGAGDAFVAGMLSVLQPAASLPPGAWPRSLVEQAVHRGCQIGSRVVTAYGATTALQGE